MDERLERLGEREVIRRLTALPGGEAGGMRTGPGDDCAVVESPGRAEDWLLTSDPVIEGVHFLPGTEAERIGHKLVGRLFSDIAAMGGEPLWVLIDVAAPGETQFGVLEGIYRAAGDLAEKYGAGIVGGDTSAGERLALHGFAVGRVPAGTALTRAGARAGDRIYVTGELGGSLQSGRHLDFEPRIAEGIWLRSEGWASSAIDISDGLAGDLAHILESSGVGAVLDAAAVPVSAVVSEGRGNLERCADGLLPLEHALFDGEDFELLFTVHPERERFFISAWQNVFDLRCTCIGYLTKKARVIEYVDEVGRALNIRGESHEHFRKGRARTG